MKSWSARPIWPGRGAGLGNAYRTYNNGMKMSVAATAESRGRPFMRWDVVNGHATTEDQPQVDLVLDTNTLAFPRYAPEMTTSRTLLEYVAGRDHQMLVAEVADPDQLAAAVAAVKRGALLQAAEAPRFAEQPIRVAAYPIAAVVAMVGPDDEPTVLDEGAGWTKVAYRGVVGYVAGD